MNSSGTLLFKNQNCKKEPKITLLKLWKTTNGFWKLLKLHHYDIVHIHCSNGQGLYYSSIARKCGVENVICHIHNTSVVGRFESIKTAVHTYFRRRYMDAPTEYMACSMTAARWLYDEEIIEGNCFRTFKNGIDIEKFKFSKDDRASIRKQLKFENKKVLCTIGRCVKEKNQIHILRVLEELLKSDDNYRLILIGQGKLEGKLKDYACSHKIDNYISFIKSTDVVEKYMSASDFFLLSSAASEGLGIVAIESQANGLVTIISDNVPDDVLITPYCHKISLSEGVNNWAKTIQQLETSIKNQKRENVGKYVELAGYEINKVTEDLQALYERLIVSP